MTREHDVVRDLMAPVALGAAEPHEIARVEAHAAECAVCREDLAGLRTGADALALSVPQVDPPPGLRESIMATVRAEAAAMPAAAAAPAPARARARRRWRLPALRPWPALAVAAALIAGLVAWNVALQVRGDDRPAVTALAVAGTDDAPVVEGRVLYAPEDGTAVVRLSRLPPAGAGKGYELWVIENGAPRSAGFLELVAPGVGVGLAADLGEATALAVTPEPLDNLDVPTGPMIVEVPLPARG